MLVVLAALAPSYAEVAQSVEHRSEKPGVASSILALGTFVYEAFGLLKGEAALLLPLSLPYRSGSM